MKKHVIVSEKMRPLWQRIIAALLFTTAIIYLSHALYYANWNNKNISQIGHNIETFIYIMGFGIAFSFHQSVYIDLKKSKFRSTIEIGPFKFGKWKTIQNYEYVSVFHQPLQDGNKIYEVNLWYNRNKHWELYEKYDYKEAFLIGFEISDLLKIDLLDATIPNNFKWVDKTASKETGKMVYSK